MVEQPELFHPGAVDPLPAPHLQQSFLSSGVVPLVHLAGNSSAEVHQVTDIDLYPFAVAEGGNELLCVADPDPAFALLQKVPVYEVYQLLSEGQLQLR